MNYKIMAKILSWVLALNIIFMLPALAISAATGDIPVVKGFIFAILFTMAASWILALLARNAKRRFFAREGLVCTGLSWIILSLSGCLPFFISGRIPNFIDAYFEIVSGFTTTGASVVADVEALGKGLLYWRSFSHWVGGMGVLVFFLAIIPASGRSDGYMLHILRAESPGPSVSKMVPKMRKTAGALYLMYCGLTVLDIIFLMIGKLPFFDACCIAFGTAGTGGFAVLNSGLSTYTPFAQYVTTVFMLLFGVNFGLYYLLIIKRMKAALKDEELRMYLGIVAAAIILIAINIWRRVPDVQGIEATFRHSAFQVASIITTTGYSTVDFDVWPSLSKAILICLMFVGASAGSTGGGIKVSRVLLLIKNLRRNAHQIFHPHEVRVVRMNGQKVGEQTILNVNSYLAAYVIIVIVSFLVLSADRANFSMTTNFSAVMATFNNIGPGFDSVGATMNYSGYSNLSTLIMCVDMLLGRLEIFPILALLSASSYRRS